MHWHPFFQRRNMEKEELLKKRFEEKAKRAYNAGIYTFTEFLDMHEQEIFHSVSNQLSYIHFTLWGGKPGCERQMVRFGDEETMGYVQNYPISCVKISPLNMKFADKLSHRDFLGALMNLGIERDRLGDIVICDSVAFLFCLESIAPFIADNLTQVKHTSVKCEITEYVESDITEEKKILTIQVSSPRLDAVISKSYNLSRGESAQNIIAQRVFVNGRLCENVSHALKEGDIISFRGKGRLTVLAFKGMSKKGKNIIEIEKSV